ncbi:hypothetical protein EDC01DRAFT_674136 [Geopyxis carbonaria]|nr:hypothetical protein EDC01DRAFT_674136 [Geopyxis carbonaria]
MLSRSILKHSAAAAPTARLLPAAVRSVHKGPNERASEAKIPSRDSIDVGSKEGTRSGTNEEIAHNAASYDPSTTDPLAEKRQTGVEEHTAPDGAMNPLGYSGASPEVSHQQADDRGAKGKDRGPSGGKAKGV